ncbi:MAG: ClbS/DfsB family four-helix bundle protein [Anaerolineaceae bacterium]|nr:ClbS/DfsB family four-helix bundle protein [Anaerolineaceae bacterium]
MKLTEVLSKVEAGRKAWVELLESVPVERRDEPGACGEWTVKDVLVHMNYWQATLVTMLFNVRQGGTVKTVNSEEEVQENNQRWYEQGKDRLWELAWADSEGLHRQILRRVREFNDEELNRANLHPALGKKPLWQWVAQDTWGHVEEHAELIKQWLANNS